jgi:hypothetical protein
MTIIAWDGKSLAWDSRATDEDRKHTVKKFRTLKDGRTVVVAGFLADLDRVRKLLDGNGWPELPTLITDRSSVVVWDRGKVFEYDESSTPRQVKKNTTWGSGAPYAIGALAVGADAATACKVACRYSSSCGGKIHTISKE